MKRVLTVCLLLGAITAFSQEKQPQQVQVKDRNLPKGNKAFDSKDYTTAEAEYRISGSNEPGKSIASYNLGNAIYRQKKPAESAFAYARAIEMAKTKEDKHRAFHNMGNALMELKDYQNAVEAYKNALRNNPADEQTRYNYALAKKMLKQNPPPPPQKNNDKDKKDQQDKNKDNKNQDPNKGGGDDKKDQDKDKKDGKDKQDNNQDKGDNKDKKNGDGKDKNEGGDPKPSGASPNKDQMERMLDAMNNEEKKVQDKLKNGKKVRGQQVKPEKDW